jgi:hypothetical protein
MTPSPIESNTSTPKTTFLPFLLSVLCIHDIFGVLKISPAPVTDDVHETHDKIVLKDAAVDV